MKEILPQLQEDPRAVFLCSLVHRETKPKKKNYLSLTGNQPNLFSFVFRLAFEQCYRISGLWKELKSVDKRMCV